LSLEGGFDVIWKKEEEKNINSLQLERKYISKYKTYDDTNTINEIAYRNICMNLLMNMFILIFMFVCLFACLFVGWLVLSWSGFFHLIDLTSSGLNLFH
jgi:hypothetical protein